MIDLFGCDAIWIQEGKSVGVFGHSGLMIQDTIGDWWYFYWGPEKISVGMFFFRNVKASPLLSKIGESRIELCDIDSVKSTLSSVFGDSSDRVNHITETVYFEGDYSKTFDYCSSLLNSDIEYNLYFNNCFQVSARAMAESNKLFTDVDGMIPNIGYLKVLTIPKSTSITEKHSGAGGIFSAVPMVY
jgi:hypothetical protein